MCLYISVYPYVFICVTIYALCVGCKCVYMHVCVSLCFCMCHCICVIVYKSLYVSLYMCCGL